MKQLQFHSYEFKFSGRVRRVLSIFVACHNLSSNEFDTRVASALSTSLVPDIVRVVGYQEDVGKIRGWLTSDNNVTIDRLRTFLDVDSTALCFITFEEYLGNHVAILLNGDVASEPGIVEINRRHSLLATFRDSGGMQIAPVGTHFAKTSDSHSDRFLRVSNIVEDGANVRLIAFWLMPYLWNKKINSLVVDTSGIYAIAATAIHEASARGGLQGDPFLWSHRSYEGLADIDTHHVSSAIFFISASTSGGLASRLCSLGAASDQIVTLFSLSELGRASSHVLCDLLAEEGKDGIEPIKNSKANSCELCNENLHLIKIQGDQFSITPPNISLIEIKATDLPIQVKTEISAVLGLRAFVAFRRSYSGRIATLGLNAVPILNGKLSEKNRSVLTAKREKWAEYVRRSSAISTRHVVATSYPGSEKIAKVITKNIKNSLLGKSRPLTITPELLSRASPQPGTSTIVVAACIDEEKELLSVSRTLRDVQEGGTTSYLAVADMIGSKAEHDRLRSNLTFGKHGAATFNLHSLFSFPVGCYEAQSSWEAESSQLKLVIDWCDEKEKDIPENIERRIQRLQEATAEGLIDDLFWTSIEGQALELRSDFTLIGDARRNPCATQADLFAVICLVLSNLRNSSVVSQRLAHNAYERAVLTPHNFDRFNDGVLQACLLRAAHPKELAYATCDRRVSEMMLEVLLHALPNIEVPEKSEAINEFLIALLTRRMTIYREHLIEFCQKLLLTSVDGSDAVKIIAEYLIDREGN